MNYVRLAVRRDAFLRGFALSFIELFAPTSIVEPSSG